MITALIYVIAYFVIGFIVGKMKKFHDEIYAVDTSKQFSYATLAIIWLPFYALKGAIVGLSLLHKFYREKI